MERRPTGYTGQHDVPLEARPARRNNDRGPHETVLRSLHDAQQAPKHCEHGGCRAVAVVLRRKEGTERWLCRRCAEETRQGRETLSVALAERMLEQMRREQ